MSSSGLSKQYIQIISRDRSRQNTSTKKKVNLKKKKSQKRKQDSSTQADYRSCVRTYNYGTVYQARFLKVTAASSASCNFYEVTTEKFETVGPQSILYLTKQGKTVQARAQALPSQGSSQDAITSLDMITKTPVTVLTS